jgi:hypothetical protein
MPVMAWAQPGDGGGDVGPGAGDGGPGPGGDPIGAVDAMPPAPRTLHVGIGVNTSIPELILRIITAATIGITFICTALFLIGAFMLVFSAGKEDTIGTAKDMMTKSLMGMAVVLGSYAIIRTLFFVVYFL